MEQQHDVYNATSRSVELRKIPKSLRAEEEVPRFFREDLPVEGARVFVLRNFFTPEECKFFIDATEGVGYDEHSDLAAEYPPEYRNNQRLIVISPKLGDSVWRRLQPQLRFKDVHNITPIGYATEGLWLPSSVNSGFLFGRYKPGQYFKPHYDGMYKNSNEEVSIYTITVYLNDNYTGGAVKFMRSREDPTVLYTYQPRQGDALIFNHDVYHEGEILQSNTKYLMRTCLMFQRLSNLSDPNKPWEQDPVWLEMRADFAKFDEILAEKHPQKFADTYTRLQAIQLQHARSIKPALHSILPLEILVEILMRMELKTLGRSVRVCKAWHSLSIHGAIWREIYARQWGRSAVNTIEGINAIVAPEVVNWQEKFRLRRAFTRACQEKLICFAGEYFYAKKGVKTTSFLAAVTAETHPWDNSFAGFELSNEGGIRYSPQRGVVASMMSACPFACMFDLARVATHRGDDYSAERVIVVTNRLAWGAVRGPDVVIGTGVAAPKELLTLKSFDIEYEDELDYATIKSKSPLVRPIDPSITCVSEKNACLLSFNLIFRGAMTVSYVDRPLVLAYSQSCRNALVISEEHEYSDMPAQLTITPVINYKIVHEHEKLVEIYYSDIPEDDANVNQLVETIRNIVKALGGPQKIDSKILFSCEEETVVRDSFLCRRGERLGDKLKACGFSVVTTEIKDVLEGADIFSHSEFYDNSVIISKDNLEYFNLY